MLYQKNALQHFSFAESPLSKEEKKFLGAYTQQKIQEMLDQHKQED